MAKISETDALKTYLYLRTEKHWDVVPGSEGAKFECKEFEEAEARAMREVLNGKGAPVRLIFQGRSTTMEIDKPVLEKLFRADIAPVLGEISQASMANGNWTAEADAIRSSRAPG